MRPSTLGSALKSVLLLLFLVVAALLTAGLSVAASGAQGDKFAPAGDGFAVSFPGRPQKATRQQSYGAFDLNMSSYGLDHEGVGYFVTWFGDLPAAAMREPLLEDMFYTRLEQNIIVSARAAGKTDLAVTARTNHSLGSFNGRQYVFDSATDMGVLRVYKVGLRFYAVGVFGPKGRFAAQRAVGFLESFTLTQKQ